jgi:hypothetical protein
MTMKEYKEYIVRIPEDEVEIVSTVLEKFGAEICPVGIEEEKKISNKKKGDPLALFGKFPDFPLNPKTFRKDLWERNQEL